MYDCLYCGKELPATSCVSGEPIDTKPREGDLTVCGYCSMPMMITRDGFAKVDIDQLPLKARRDLRKALAAIEAFKRFQAASRN